MEHKYTAIILNKKDIGETDRIYTIYTLEQGKISAIARGVRKPQAKLASGLENFNLVDICIVKNKGLGNIKSVIVENSFSNARKNLEVLQNIFQVVKTFNKLVGDNESDKKVFDLLAEYLLVIDKIVVKNDNQLSEIKLLSIGFAFKLLDLLGYRAEVSCCVICRNGISAGQNYFSAKRGGVLCVKCVTEIQNKFFVSENAIKIMRIFLTNKLKSLVKLRVEKKDINELKIILRNFLGWVS